MENLSLVQHAGRFAHLPVQLPSVAGPVHPESTATRWTNYHIIRRNGEVTVFDPDKIAVAITKAFLATEGATVADSRRVHETVAALTSQVVTTLTSRRAGPHTFAIEDIQDQVELALMRAEHHKVARAYVLYREERARQRAASQTQPTIPALYVTRVDGEKIPLDDAQLLGTIKAACANLSGVDAQRIHDEVRKQLYDGIREVELAQALILSARTLIETDPHYSFVTARLLLEQMRREAIDFLENGAAMPDQGVDYVHYFPRYVQRGIELSLLDPRLREFDLNILAAALKPERDQRFTYLGLQTLYDRYFIHAGGVRFELPQAFFMRVAMGLALNELDREARAIEFYEILSSFDFMCSTPTLFNAGTLRPQLSSCYLTTVPDSLDGIYSAIRDNALLSKFAGGLGNDWTRVRAAGAGIKGTNGKSQGVVPFLKVANDTAVAVNQGGKRKGAVCAYLETWHLDIEEFLDMRKNTGDERRRTPDMNTAHWIPDLFMKRVHENSVWTLFSPDDVPDLHDLYGGEFEAAYRRYEEQAERGVLAISRRIPAAQLWRKMLTLLFETGHPWITFKDACNVRSPQNHAGVVHSSNLCTEITLNTSDQEIAVCNLGSVNLAAHVGAQGIDHDKLRRTVSTAMRMLDNVIDVNYYAVPQARASNLRHRPVGLGLMGFQDALHILRIPYDSQQAVNVADVSAEALSHYALEASAALAQERGKYSSFAGSLWSRGVLPLDSIELLARERGGDVEVNRDATLDWDALRRRIQATGLRNSNCLAIAPTATIANICGVSASIEPTFQNLFVKSNLSGEFTVANPFLADDLKQRGLWDEVMVNDLKYFNGSVQHIARVPEELKALYKCAFEIEPVWLVEAAARRQKWLDQSQSLNLYVAQPSGKKLDALYKLAWRRGLKTTYYLRTLGATATEKSTIADGVLNAVSLIENPRKKPVSCGLDNSECEVCQ